MDLWRLMCLHESEQLGKIRSTLWLKYEDLREEVCLLLPQYLVSELHPIPYDLLVE
jgi:hypothetical protein